MFYHLYDVHCHSSCVRVSLVPRPLARGRERAWYTLHVHALVPQEKAGGLVYYRLRPR